MANELNEQQYAAPEQELRSEAPIEMAQPEAANKIETVAPEIASNDGAAKPAPAINFRHSNSFGAFSYGDPQKKDGIQKDDIQESLNELKDITVIANGYTQKLGDGTKGFRAGGNNDNGTSVRAQQELQRQQAEQQRIAAWNNTRTVIGGVSMTQAQALNALQKINDDPEAYVKRALEEGRIKKGEEEEYKRTAKRMQELLEKDKEGKLSAPEKQEKMELEKSRMGEIVSHDIGTTVEKDNAYNQSTIIKNAERDGGSYAKSGISDFSVKPEFTAAAQPRQISGETAPSVANMTAENTEQVKKNNASVPGLG